MKGAPASHPAAVPMDDAAASLPATGRWYAVQTSPGKDRLAASHLARQQFSVFAPRLQKTIRHARQFRVVTVPLFPGYLFLRINLSGQRWRAVNGTFGVRTLVMSGSRPLPIPDATIAQLQQAFGTRAAAPRIAPGQQVKVLQGPLSGFVGTLERLEGPERVRVLMELIGGTTPVTLDRSAIAASS
jgi:transcription elongation factor/antiterminator RfaH